MNSGGFYKHKRSIITLILVLFVCLLGYEIYFAQTFHVISTNPKTSSISTISPFLQVNFSKKLSSQGVSINSPGGASNSYQVQGKTLIIKLNYPLAAKQIYTIYVNDIYDSAGTKINQLRFSFTPIAIPYNDLTPEEQKALVNSQDTYSGPGVNINYVNTDLLINDGFSSTQLSLFEKYFAEFNPTAKTVTVEPGSVGSYAAPSPAVGMYKFNINVEGTEYSAQATYTFLNNLSLFLLNSQTGTLVFDSDTYSSPGGD